jgi:8-oxo-dGTP pyrophosphatase MutT (NUDIX family)
MSKEVMDPRLDTITDCLYRVSAKAIIIRENKILLVKETGNWWSLPGGGIDHGETVVTALSRELSEELGASPEQITIDEQVIQVVLGQIVDNIPRVCLVYKTDIPQDSIKATDHVIGFEWVTAAQLEQLEINQIVRDTKPLIERMLQ